MSERFPGAEVPPVTDEQLLSDPNLWPRYRDEHAARAKAGEEVWMLRNPDGSSDMDPGVVRDFWSGGEYIGYIDCDDDAGMYIPYRRAEGEEDHSQRMGDEIFGHLSEAEKVLRDYAEKAVLKDK